MSTEKDGTINCRKGRAGFYFVASVLTMVFLVTGWLQARPSSDQPTNTQEGQVTLQGCVTRLSGDFVLTRTDPGNSYVLHAAHNIKLAKYLGQQVMLTGTKSPTLGDTSDSARSAPSITITVNSISSVSKECKD